MNTRQRGFSIVAAIFLLVILAALGAYAVNLSSVQHTSAASDELGSRAYHAAKSGIEWGVWQVLHNGGNCAASTDLTLPGSLAPFTVTVECASTSHKEANNMVTLYRLTATACNQPDNGACPNNGTPGPIYIERQVQGTVER